MTRGLRYETTTEKPSPIAVSEMGHHYRRGHAASDAYPQRRGSPGETTRGGRPPQVRGTDRGRIEGEIGGAAMTYKKLFDGCYTSEAQKIADELMYLNGFQTEAEQGDVELVEEADLKAMG